MILIAALIITWLTAAHWYTFVLLTPALWFLDTGLLLALYLAAMHLDDARDDGKITPEAMPIMLVLGAVGYAQDCIYNLTWAIAVFLDLPREPFVTGRLERYKYGRAYRLTLDRRGERWRFWRWRVTVERADIAPATGRRLARTEWFAANLLDPFARSGVHVKP